jgi:hypothetical protein
MAEIMVLLKDIGAGCRISPDLLARFERLIIAELCPPW